MDNDCNDDLMNYCYYCMAVAARKDRDGVENDSAFAAADNDADFDGIHSDIGNLREYFYMDMNRMYFGVEHVESGDFHNS
jgi:hypothetical protein